MLHLIFQAPLEKAVLERIAGHDDVVFHDAAAWCVLRGHDLQPEVERLIAKNCRVHLLRDEMELNGIGMDQLLSGIEVIDYAGLVALTVANKVIKTWR